MNKTKDFSYKRDKKTAQMWVETSLSGKSLMSISALNKGTAFSTQERKDFGLLGKLPYQIESIDEQKIRAYSQYKSFRSDIGRHSFLKNLHSINETLFYSLVRDHLNQMLPIIYTPTVGEAVKQYSKIFLSPRGLYISYPQRHHILEILKNRTNYDIDVIVVSDAEGVLGIGDQGIGGIEIPVAKLMVYTLCAGVNPGRYLPIFLDAGTNNKELLDDPMYLGWRNERVSGKDYDEMIELFISAVKTEMPGVFLHWEDFGRDNARKNLLKYEDSICSFNDDMQGTAAVLIAALLSACKKANIDFCAQKIVIFGAGTAGIGIADELVSAFKKHGLTDEQAYDIFWCVDKDGLIVEGQDIPDFQKPYMRTKAEIKDWQLNDKNTADLLELVLQVKPTTLIGSSGVSGAFTDDIIKTMSKANVSPIIFPLSNPTSNCERSPVDIIKSSKGKALVATGSPFEPVGYEGKVYRIAQSNNALVFPGIGLGVIAMKCKKLTENMLWQACNTLANYPINDDGLLPPLSEAYNVSRQIAFAVARQAIEDGVTHVNSTADIWDNINNIAWEPIYYPYKKQS